MRLWFFVLLEAAVVASAGVVVVAGARHLGGGFQSADARTMKTTVVLPVEQEPLEPQPLDPTLFASDATGTFLGSTFTDLGRASIGKAHDSTVTITRGN